MAFGGRGLGCRRGLGGAWGLDGSSKEGGLVGWLAWQFHRRGQGLGGESKGFGSGRVGVLFFESWRVDLVTCSRLAVCLVLLGGQGRVGLAGQGLRGGPRASVPGGVGGRGTGPRDGANFVSYKKRKMAFFEGCSVGWGGVPTGAGLVDGGVEGWGGRDGSFKEGGGLGLGWLFQKRGKSRKGLACLAVS